MIYVQKAVEVDILQWDGTLHGLDELYIKFGEAFSKVARFKYMTMDESISLTIKTPTGNIKACKGDYIVKGATGDFDVCKQDRLNQLYAVKGGA